MKENKIDELSNILKLSDIDLGMFIDKGTSLESIPFMIRHYNFDFDVFLPTKNKNLQRDFVWNNEQKEDLIISILKGVTLPNISLWKIGSENFKVIDGKQRLSTIFDFVKGKFPINYKGKKYFYKNLDSQAQERINNPSLRYDVLNTRNINVSDDQLIDWFEALNFKGTPQFKSHMSSLRK